MRAHLFISSVSLLTLVTDLCTGEITTKVALLQMMPSKTANLTENIAIADSYCRQAKQLGADIALMPELWSVGYDVAYPGYNPADQSGHFWWLGLAVAENSSYVQHFQQLAVELDMAIGLTYLQAFDPLPRNSISLIDRHGSILFTYAKVHTCDWLPMEGSTFPGDGFYVSQLDTANGNISVGAMICFDREQPESARILMLQGAELVLTPNSCILAQNQIDQFKTRAFENDVVVAMANYPSPYQNGWSCAYSGNGTEIVSAGDNSGEGIYMAEFDVQALRLLRTVDSHGDAFRRPYVYDPLLTLQKQRTFTRPNFFNRDRLF